MNETFEGIVNAVLLNGSSIQSIHKYITQMTEASKEIGQAMEGLSDQAEKTSQGKININDDIDHWRSEVEEINTTIQHLKDAFKPMNDTHNDHHKKGNSSEVNLKRNSLKDPREERKEALTAN